MWFRLRIFLAQQEEQRRRREDEERRRKEQEVASKAEEESRLLQQAEANAPSSMGGGIDTSKMLQVSCSHRGRLPLFGLPLGVRTLYGC